MVGPGKTLHDSTRKSLQKFDVIIGYAASKVVELFNSLPAGPVLRTSMHYSITLCCQLDAANDAMSGMFMRLIAPDKAVSVFRKRLQTFYFTKSST